MIKRPLQAAGVTAAKTADRSRRSATAMELRPRSRSAVDGPLAQRAFHADRPSGHVDVAAPECTQLAQAQAGERAELTQGAVPCVDGIGEREDLAHRQAVRPREAGARRVCEPRPRSRRGA